jgi:hypothetical protein
MTIIGQKNMFAIEWNVTKQCSYGESVGTDWSVRYWANSQQIGETSLHSAIGWPKQYFLKYRKHWRLPIDFSDISKEDIFYQLSPYFTREFPEKYHDFYIRCKKLMLEEYHSKNVVYSKSAQKRIYSKDAFEKSIFLGDTLTDDNTLMAWIYDKFGIGYLLGDDDIQKRNIYIVHDIAKNQERLIWKYFDFSIIQEFPVHEAVLSMDYFDKVLMEFVETASQSIENENSNSFQYDTYEFLISYPCCDCPITVLSPSSSSER